MAELEAESSDFEDEETRTLKLELELRAGAQEPGFFKGAGALSEIQVELEPVV